MPFDDGVLSDAILLTRALRSTVLAKIPVDRLIVPGSGLAVPSVFVKNDNGEEAVTFVDRFSAFEQRSYELRSGMSEENVLACVTEVTGMMWRLMASFFQDFAPVFKVLYNKKDLSGATEGDGRPDETDYLNDFMVCKSEHKESNLHIAISELTSKLSGYNHIEYGLRIIYLPVIAAAGTMIQFGFVDVRTKVYHHVARYDIMECGARVECFVRMINFFRLIHTMAPHIPANPTPLFKTINNITYYESHIMKKLPVNCTCPDALYEHLAVGKILGAVTVRKGRGVLKVSPKGVRTPDRGKGLFLEDVRAAVKSILLCLSGLHALGFVHRDLRWANLIRVYSYHHVSSLESCEFLVIDFEFAERDGAAMNIAEYIHNDVVPYGATYSYLHDLKLVGKMIQSWADVNHTDLDESAANFINAITRLEDPLSASDAQQHAWLHARCDAAI